MADRCLLSRPRDMVRKGELIPHINVTTVDGERFAYSDIWQRKNLVLVALPPEESDDADDYLSLLASRLSDVTGGDTACVVTRRDIPGIPASAVVVADRWGEIHH